LTSYLGMTGTPGTGKKTLAPMVAAVLKIPFRSLNEIAFSSGLAGRRGGEVDPAALRRRVLSTVEAPSLLYGHLLPYTFRRGDFARVVVLRCEPAVLKARLLARGYAKEKVADNVEAELIGVVSADSLAAFGRGRVFEVDTSGVSVRDSAAAVAEGLAKRKPSVPVDWVPAYGSAARLRSLLGPKTPSA